MHLKFGIIEGLLMVEVALCKRGTTLLVLYCVPWLIINVIGKMDILPLMCAADKIWITEMTYIHKNIRSIRNLHT